MALYYVNNVAQANGDHEVHRSGCTYMPLNKAHLGEHATCRTAVVAAKVHFRQSNGCAFCSRECHTT